MTDLPPSVEAKVAHPMTQHLHLVLIWNMAKLQELLDMPESQRSGEMIGEFMASEFVTIYMDYPFDPMEMVALRSPDQSDEMNERRRQLYQEFVQSCAELHEQHRVPEALGVMRPVHLEEIEGDEPTPGVFGLYLLDKSFLPKEIEL